MTEKVAKRNLTLLSRIFGMSTALVTCAVGVRMTSQDHTMGIYVLIFSALIFLLEIQWVVNLLVNSCAGMNDSFGFRCWSVTLVKTSGWRRGLFYLPIACLLVWKPHKLWLSFFDAVLLVILTILHSMSSAPDQNSTTGQTHQPAHSMGENLLNGTSDYYTRFDEVLVTEVMEDCIPSSKLQGCGSYLEDDASGSM